MKILRLVLFVSVVFCQSAQAQTYAFKVLINKGKNEVKSGSSWQAVKVGGSLQTADEIRVAENSYIGLVHASGKPIEIKQPGNYRVADLAGKVNGGSTVLNKYTDFILSTNDKKRGMAVTGAQHRGTEVTADLPLSKGSPVLIYNPEVIVAWEKSEKFPAPYIVRFTNMFGDELFKQEVSTTTFTVNLEDARFAKESNVLVQVLSKTDKTKATEEYSLRRVAKAERERIKSSLAEIAKQTSEPTALNKFILAGFYEQNNLLIDAVTAYQEAMKLAPDVATYREEYEAFLIRTNIRTPQK